MPLSRLKVYNNLNSLDIHRTRIRSGVRSNCALYTLAPMHHCDGDECGCVRSGGAGGRGGGGGDAALVSRITAALAKTKKTTQL